MLDSLWKEWNASCFLKNRSVFTSFCRDIQLRGKHIKVAKKILYRLFSPLFEHQNLNYEEHGPIM